MLLIYRGVDSIDDMMADIAEQHEVAQEISDTISRPIGPGIDFDEVKWWIRPALAPYSQMEIRNINYVFVLQLIV